MADEKQRKGLPRGERVHLGGRGDALGVRERHDALRDALPAAACAAREHAHGDCARTVRGCIAPLDAAPLWARRRRRRRLALVQQSPALVALICRLPQLEPQPAQRSAHSAVAQHNALHVAESK